MIIQRRIGSPDLRDMTLTTLRMRTRAIFVLLATLLIVNVAALEALAVQAPRPGSSLFIQTSGPNAGLNIGDYYSSPAGGDTDHLFVIRVPSDWPAGTPVTVALYDPELAGPNPVSPTAADEVRNGADTASFRLESPTGGLVASATYSAPTTNGTWVELATFDPGVTGTGSYQLRVVTSDDDDNSWRVDASHDPDCVVGVGCLPGTLVNGNEVSSSGGSGSLAIGVVRTSWQHAGSGTSCQDHYFYVNSATPRPLRAHNFDMDGNGSVTYTTPTGTSVAGTVSGNATWNNSSDANRVGDVLPDVNGWWRANVCVSSTNQYVFESPSAGPSFPEPQPAPRLDVSKDDSVGTVQVGDQVTYTITVDNVSDEDALPGDAYDLVATDTLPTGLQFDSCSSVSFTCSEAGGVVTASLASPLAPGTSASFEIVATVTLSAGVTLTNDVTVDFDDQFGNGYTETASDSNTVDFEPVLAMTVSGPVDVLRGDSASLTYTVAHDPASDQSPVSGLAVTCVLCTSFSYASGDTDGDSILDSGETWVYDAVIATGPGDPSVILAQAGASGLDLNGEPVTASVTGQVNVIEPASFSGTVFEDLNGNGVLDAGEPGIAGATVDLSGPTAASLVTGSDGTYTFVDLAPGDYTADVSGVAAPMVATTATSLSETLDPGEAFVGGDFGFAAPVTISGSVFEDSDEDGVFDAAESGLGGVAVNLLDSGGATVATTTSAADGSYEFSTMPGEYTVSVGSGIPTGWAMRTASSIDTGFLASGAVSANNDFGASNNTPVMIEGSQTIEIGELPDPLSATDPEGDSVSFSRVDGMLPPGITLNADGTFAGAATEAGLYQFDVEVCDEADPVACATFSYEVRVVEVDVAAGPDDPSEVGATELPFTGVELAGLMIMATILLAGGSGAVLGARRLAGNE
ncbi:MAG: DUF11 domain-containing protein [Actinobacteria bacterium]|nr:MAG: DUF11 domain-containing protein [Actinomycetota bacterium]